MPHALLLSPDDQAVSAITAVLEELSVTCERPLDGVSAAQKINSQSFDLVLVDCENLPAAKLIFDVCRRGKNGNNPVPIAIVDGRAGLPTAFRLGAELILTKPVAKDQARSTIRTAVSRVRKDVQPSDNVAQPADAQPADATTAETHAYAAAASASPQLTSFADPVGSSGAGAALAMMTATGDISSDVTIPIATDFASTVTSDVLTDTMNLAPLGDLTDRFSTTLAASVASATQQAHSAVEEINGSPHAPTFNSESASLQGSSSPASSPSEPSSDQAAPLTWKSAREVKPSDDPVLAELERTELQDSE